MNSGRTQPLENCQNGTGTIPVRADRVLTKFPAAPTTNIYIIRSSDGARQRCKIGLSGSPPDRLIHLRGSSPWPMQLVRFWKVPRDQARSIEQEVHQRLQDRRVRGEWFKIDPGNAMKVVLALLHEKRIVSWSGEPI